MKAIIKVDIPEFQIGQEVNIYFPDSMLIKGKTELPEKQETQIDIPMPNSCVECPISHTPSREMDEWELECPFVDLFVTNLDDERPKECPLKEK